MKNFIIAVKVVLIAAALLAIILCINIYDRWQRCEADREALLENLVEAEFRNTELTAETNRLCLTVDELRRYRADDAHRIRAMGIALRRAETVSKSAAITDVEVCTPILPVADSLSRFEWSDPWVRVCGTISPDSVLLSVSSVDTLLQVVHRVPYRWWFLRWGTKAIRQTVASSNPHTRIIYSEYVELH